MKKTSIQKKLIVGQVLVQSLVISVVSVLIYQFVASRLVEQFDYSLEQIADAATKLIELEMEGGRLELEIEDDYKPNIDLNTTFQQIWSGDGTLRYSSTNMKDQALWEFPSLEVSGKEFGEITLPDGRKARYCLMPFQPYIDDGVVVEMKDWISIGIRDSSPVDETLLKIKQGCMGFAVVAIVLSCLANWWLVRRGFRPLEQIATQVEELDLEALDQRVTVDVLPSELEVMTQKLNGMLERVQQHIEREKRFSSNVAHELRTPLAEMKMISDVGQQWKPEYLPGDDPRAYFKDAQQVVGRMSSLLETLLAISRQQKSSLHLETTSVQLGGLVEKVVKSVSVADRDLVIEAESEPKLELNEPLLEAVLINLLGNAMVHSHGKVELSFDEKKLCIANDAGSLENSDLEMLTEPFWQKDQARTSRDNFGLGLYLSQQYCEIMGLQLVFQISEDQKFVACVYFAESE